MAEAAARKGASSYSPCEGVEILGPMEAGYESILTAEAMTFVAELHRALEPERQRLLARRDEIQARIDAGHMPDFLPETREVREGDWTVAPIPADLLDRRVEITGPTDPKMVINALNSGASVFMADLEDANTPTWKNMVEGQISLYGAVRRTLEFDDPRTGKAYRLGDDLAVLMARPRGWHLPEKHVLIDGEPVSASLIDFGLYVFHNAGELVARGTGAYFYIPKLENHLEARLWNRAFKMAQDRLGLPDHAIRATILLETILAAFEMDEILYELRDYIAGLNCGRWDYIFSFIKKFGRNPDFVLPDRGQVTMTSHFLRSYSQLLIKTCHRRNAHAMGGMAAQIPIKGDEKANADALEKVRQDKLREAKDGHDGTWVAHPGLIPVAKAVFDEYMPGPNQLDKKREDVHVTAADLLRVAEGAITEAGLRQNVNVGILYTESWLRGIGCVPIYNLMEDAATAEISRTQVWQWVRHGAHFDTGETIDAALFRKVLAEELGTIRETVGDDAFQSGRFEDAAGLFDDLITAKDLAAFLTLPAYESLLAQGD